MHYKKIDPYFGLMSRREAKANHTLVIKMNKRDRARRKRQGGIRDFIGFTIDDGSNITIVSHKQVEPRWRRLMKLWDKEENE